jgi:predicted negative regulator of RcsB-dependent stress response
MSESSAGIRYDDTALNAIRAAHRRKWTTIATITAVIGTGIGVFWYSSYKKSQESALVTAYIQADKMFNTEQDAYIAEMQKPGADPSKIGKPDHLPSAKKFEEFARANASKAIAWVAAFRAASEYIEKGQTDSAIALLELVASRTMKHPLVQVRARRTLAGLYADKNDFAKALSELSILEKMTDNPMTSENRLFKAKVHFLAGQKEEAAKILNELAASTDLSSAGDRSSVAAEAALWLGYWGI